MNVIEEGHRIKDRLRDAGTVEEIERIADEERDKVLGMKGLSEDGTAMYHQIKHLKLYRLRMIREGRGDINQNNNRRASA
jgi:hypothetical protein